MTLIYGKKWFESKMRMTETWNEAQARQAHISREPYAVLTIDTNESLKHVIEFNNDFIAVGFFDKLGREYVRYHFQEKKPNHLFLTMAVHREFQGHTRSVVRGIIFTFKTDGACAVEEQDLIARTTTSGSSTKPIDASQNWEPYPNFGDYTSICRIEREEKKGTGTINDPKE